ncbi:MAG: peptide/nickel transport system ATP-binding protein [Gaiellales bacterium]|nr:peptide/nickel transport system ATP-binding protein [Gaiellales bacterium]
MTLLRRTFATPLTRISGAILLVVAVVSVAGPWIRPYGPFAQDVNALFAAPGGDHLLGTDYLGRDTLSRLIEGTRLTFEGALTSMLLGLALGALPGMGSVFIGRKAQFLAMRVIDAMLAFPPIIFAIAVVGTFGAGQWTASAAIGVLIAPRFFRIVRAETLGLAGSQYVEVAELLGSSKPRILRVHIVRKVLPTIAVTSATTMAEALLAVSALSFLGLGPPAPAATWGGMLADDLTYLSQDTYAAIWPGLAIMITVAALNVIADGLRDSSTVRLPARRLRPWSRIPDPTIQEVGNAA